MTESPPTLAGLTRTFLAIGFLSFGGPAAQIALMHRLAVEERGWLNEGQFLRALNFCMLLPGPEAQQLATYIGWRLKGWRGGVIAGGLFVLPGALVMLALSIAYVLFATSPLIGGVFLGIKAYEYNNKFQHHILPGQIGESLPGMDDVREKVFHATGQQYVFRVTEELREAVKKEGLDSELKA
ncbi:MAG: chromate transporter, partial [Bacteroidales bacterium]|nr:chromate transporter [Bacteroidales bacterium]